MAGEFSRDIKSKGIIISKSTPWGWHGIKQPSGKHNTINILLTRESGLCGMYASGKLTESRSGLRFDSGRSALIRLELRCLYTDGLWFDWIYLMRKGYCLSCCLVSGPKSRMECSSVVERWPCKLCAAGSIPAFPIPYSGGIRRRYCGSIGLNPQLRWP